MTTKEFIEKMSKDEILAKKMSECKSPEEAYEIAKEVGLTDDIDSFKAVMTEFNKQIKGELSDDELQNVAGGLDTNEWVFLGFDLAFASASAAAF